MIGARATSQHPVVRLTGCVALGVAAHQMMNGPENMFRYAPCDNGGNGSASPPECQSSSGTSTNAKSPGYGSFAMTGDFLIGPSLGVGFGH